MTEQVKALQEKVAILEAKSMADQVNLLATLKVETNNYILQRLTDGPVLVAPTPVQHSEIYDLYRRIIELTQGAVPEFN